MDPLAGGAWAIAIGLITLAGVWLVKTPKEVSSEMGRRVDDLEDAHNTLDRKFAAAESRLSTEIRHLAETIVELSRTIKHMDQARISGRHPRNQ